MKVRTLVSITLLTFTGGGAWLATACGGSTGGSLGSDAGADVTGGSSGSSSGGTGSSSGSGSSSGGSSGGGSSSGSSSGGSGSSSGSSSGGGSGSSSGGGDGGSMCPAVPCTGGDTCCADLTTVQPVCQKTCAKNDTIQCASPSDCKGGTPDCQAVLQLLGPDDAGALYPNCTVQSLSSTCVAKSTTSLTVQCGTNTMPSTQTLHVCGAPSDCSADTANPDCCAFKGYHVCVSGIIKQIGGLTCL